MGDIFLLLAKMMLTQRTRTKVTREREVTRAMMLGGRIQPESSQLRVTGLQVPSGRQRVRARVEVRSHWRRMTAPGTMVVLRSSMVVPGR